MEKVNKDLYKLKLLGCRKNVNEYVLNVSRIKYFLRVYNQTRYRFDRFPYAIFFFWVTS